MKKGIVALLVFVLVSMAFCAWSPGAMAQPDYVEIDESHSLIRLESSYLERP